MIIDESSFYEALKPRHLTREQRKALMSMPAEWAHSPTENYDPDQPRDEQGRWSTSGIPRSVEEIQSALAQGNAVMSRTRGASPEGITAAAEKVLMGTAAEKAARVQANDVATAELVRYYAYEADLTYPKDVHEMLNRINDAVNQGLVPPQTPRLRTWDTEKNAVKGKDVPAEFAKFTRELHQRWDDKDKVATAAWAEWQLNAGDLHPFYDGSGRTSRAVAATILLSGGKPLPRYEGTERYFAEANKGVEAFTEYFRSLIPKE